MREILFRGKAINRVKGREYRTNYNNGDWVYGLITKLYNEKYDSPAEMRNECGIDGIEVDYKTIGQYTGIKDKNGVKIFEGDVVDILTENEEAGVVRWNEAGFIVNADGFVLDFQNHLSGSDVSVVGNIYDNPELLETEDEEG